MNYIKIVRRECRSRNITTVLFLPYIIKSFNASAYASDAVTPSVHDVERLVRAYI